MKWLRRMRDKIMHLTDKITVRITGYMNKSWKNTGNVVCYLSLLFISLVAGIGGMELSPYPQAGFLICACLALVISSLGMKIVIRILQMIGKWDTKQALGVVAILLLSGELGMLGNLGNFTLEGAFIGMLFGTAMILTVKAGWAFFHNRVRTWMVTAVGLAGILITCFGCMILLGEGFSDTYVEEYLGMAEDTMDEKRLTDREAEAFRKEFEMGMYTVESIEYGTDEDAQIKSEYLDLSYCVQNPDGLEGIWRSYVSDYDVKEAPIRGKIWYPADKSKCPVFYFVHGNHNILTESYLGYEYLGEYLASHGYVVVSVDENVLNMLGNENDARAILLLENMKKTLQFNREEGNPLYEKLDEERIVIGGHSRGGEMASTAYLFHDYDCYPENGMRKFHYDFNIQGVVAVAPSVNQYMPADHEVELQDTNYLLIQGANDQDINIFLGNTQYENVTFTGNGDYIKSSLYIVGANHGQFNSLWGRYDLSQPNAAFLNVKNLMEMEQQQDILKIYVKIFLDKVLKEDETYEELLWNQQKYAGCMPQTIYIQQYADSGEEVLCDYGEDSNLVTAGSQNVVLDASHMRIWREEMLYYSNEELGLEKGNYALRLKWADTTKASYTFRMKQSVSLEEKGIAFDICDMKEEKADSKTSEMLNPHIVIRDIYGNEAVIETEKYVAVYPPLPVKLSKLQYLTGSSEYKHPYQTVYITAKQLQEECRELELTEIAKITLAFPQNESGDISVDNIRINCKI